jgi:phosphoribosylformimino-5-aminoimidazole carboxamide ribotide isomerase
MIIFPAIDLKNGQCVRLYKGDMEQATVFNENPVSQALEFQKQGFKYLHIVDLDGAIKGKSVNEDSVKAILDAVKIPVQLGGGIRDMAAIEEWLGIGVSRVILGTAAAKNPNLVIEACKKFPGKIAVGIDARDGIVATEGWVSSSEITALELGKKFENCGVAAIIYTDISRDGTMQGVDIKGTKDLAKGLSIPVIASGGISSMKDVIEVKKLDVHGVVGLIVGRALYDKMIDAKDLASL